MGLELKEGGVLSGVGSVLASRPIGVRVVSAALHSNRRADNMDFMPRRGLVVTHTLLRSLGISHVRITSTHISSKRVSTIDDVYQ